MYIPGHFQTNDLSLLCWLLDHDSFVTLISTQDGTPVASHLPVQPHWDGDKLTLEGHWARVNPQWQGIESQTVCAIVHGPHTYVSPRWYRDGDRRVPTWNYAVAHLYGRIELVESAEDLRRMLTELAARFEPTDETGWTLDSTSYNVAGGLRAIMGFRIHVERIEMKAKLNQNHPVENVRNVITKLEEEGGDDNKGVALLMRKDKRLTQDAHSPDPASLSGEGHESGT